MVGLVPVVAHGGSTRCEGFGASTAGGASGATYRVTTLADDGPGSLRDAVSQGDRLVVFDVAGEIALVGPVFVNGANVTIDGTTAPAPGITLSRGGLAIRGSRGAHDVIVKGLRIRQAPGDGIQVAFGASHVVVEGVSIAHSQDGNLDVSGASDVTVCRSFLAEPFSHTMAVRDGASRVTLHDNLITGSLTSSPGVYIDELGTPATDTTLDMRNNVVLNWENGYGTAVHHGAVANVVNNLYYSPNSAPEDRENAIIVCTGDCNDDPASTASAYVAGNRSGTPLPFDLNAATTAAEPFAAPAVTTGSACNVAHRVVGEAGVRPLDDVDQRQLTFFVRLPSLCSVDLVVAAMTAPPAAAAGATVSVEVQVKNRGQGPVEDRTTIGVYLSPSSSLTFDPATAVEVGTASAPPIGVDETVTVTVPVQIPATAGATGFYRLFAVVDADEILVETIETNNATSIDVRVGPDLVVDAVGVPGWAQAGTAVTVTDTVRNRGFSPSGASLVRYYFSSSTTVDASAVAIGQRTLLPVTEGTTDTGSASVTIPETAGAAGTYYVVAVVDPDNSVVETDEANNVRSARVLVGPDMVVDSVSGPATAVGGETITLTDTTRNRGVGPAGASLTRYYVSAKSVLDATAVAIGQREVPPLAAGATSTGPVTLTVPASLGSAGIYYVLAVADGAHAVVEADETNNTGPAWEVRIGPDLVVDTVAGPATAVAGESMTVTDTTRNRGVGPARASVTRFYISAKAAFDATAVAIGQREVPPLAAGGVSTGSATVAIPAGLGAASTYYVLAMADGGNAVVERDETNNTGAAWTVRIGPDLVVDALTGPGTAMSGETITITDSTRNRGVSPAAPTITRYYFSTKPTFDAEAVLLGSRPVPALAPAAVSAGSSAITIPGGLPATGTYYVLAMADGEASVVEADETNNALRAWKVVMSPDLIVDALSGPTTAVAGEAVTVTDTIRNRGLSPIAATTARYYLSTKLTLDAEAIPLGSRAVPSLAAGAVSTGSVSLVIPATVGAAGTYYVLVSADGAGAVTELDEVNNVRAWRVTIAPDLVVDLVSGPVATVGGEVITVSDTTRNRGFSGSAPTVTRFYLSPAPAYAPGAVPLGERAIPALAAGATSAGATALTIPWWVGDLGQYYLVAVADGASAVAEPDETNNGRAARIAIGADLIIDSAVVPASVGAGEQFDVTDFVRNRGVGPSSASTLRFYLSTRKTYDPFLAMPLGVRSVPALAAGETSTGTTTLALPATTTPGVRYLIGVVDPGNKLTELNEDNNGRYWVITVP
jgi:subtilase family serine protease